jgi:hypothetical protein
MRRTRWKWTIRRARPLGIAAVCAGLAAIVLGAIPAGALTGGGFPASKAAGRFAVGEVSATSTGVQTSSKFVCKPPRGWDNRTQACVMDGAVVYFKNSKGNVVGYTSFIMTQAMQLNPRSLGFSEVITVAKVATKGENQPGSWT